MSIGLHIGKNGRVVDYKHKTMLDAITTESILLDISSLSLYTSGPRDKSKISMQHQEIKKYCAEKNIVIFPHGSYISCGIWNVNKANRHENKSLMFIRHIKDQLVDGKQLGAKGIVIHLPKHPIETVVETMEIISDCKVINSIRNNAGVMPNFTIEMPAAKPDELLTYETPEKLNKLTNALTNNKLITLPWDLCIDTCHMWAGGINFKDNLSWFNWESKLTDETKSKIHLIHLNGAKGTNFGTGKDSHSIACSKEDDIWKHLISDTFRSFLEVSTIQEFNACNMADHLSDEELDVIKESSLFAIVQFAKKNNIAMICEPGVKDYKGIKFIIDLVNKLLKL